MHQVESGFALNVLFNINIFEAITLQKCSVAMWNSYSCNWFNNPQQGRFVTIALWKYILFLINSVWTVSFWLVCLFVVFNPLPICSQGEGNLISTFSPGLAILVWFDQGLCQIPLCAPGLGGGGFNWLVHYAVAFTREFIMIRLGSLKRDYSLFRVFIGVITLNKGWRSQHGRYGCTIHSDHHDK